MQRVKINAATVGIVNGTGQQVVKIVNEALTDLMGGQNETLNTSGTSPVSVMLVGLQGFYHLKSNGKHRVERHHGVLKNH